MPPPADRATRITLRALEGEPLGDARIRDMVIASAEALAERHGMTVLHTDNLPDELGSPPAHP